MPEFKVGDKVRVTEDCVFLDRDIVGYEFEVRRVGNDRFSYGYGIEAPEKYFYYDYKSNLYFGFELELVN